jgi:hypothetical protein
MFRMRKFLILFLLAMTGLSATSAFAICPQDDPSQANAPYSTDGWVQIPWTCLPQFLSEGPTRAPSLKKWARVYRSPRGAFAPLKIYSNEIWKGTPQQYKELYQQYISDYNEVKAIEDANSNQSAGAAKSKGDVSNLLIQKAFSNFLSNLGKMPWGNIEFSFVFVDGFPSSFPNRPSGYTANVQGMSDKIDSALQKIDLVLKAAVSDPKAAAEKVFDPADLKIADELSLKVSWDTTATGPAEQMQIMIDWDKYDTLGLMLTIPGVPEPAAKPGVIKLIPAPSSHPGSCTSVLRPCK